jgi:broad specificity phosphatase PhoE
MTRFWWVRHGPTHEKAFVGWRDVPADLSDTARLARLDAHLPKGALIVSSDLVRASATAAVLAEGRKALPADPALREINFGAWDGLHWSQASARDPELTRAFWENPGDIAPPEGESWNAVSARVDGFVARMLADHAGRDIVAVAHFGVILTRIQKAGGLTAEAALGHQIEPLSVTQTGYSAAGWYLGDIGTCP